MPKKTASTSSDSSSDDDLAKFQSVAVTFEDITSNAKDVVEKAKRRISGRKRKSEKKGDGEGDEGTRAGSDDDGDDGPLDYLTPVQLKVAAALDSVLEGRLRHKEPTAKRLKKEAKAAAKVAAADAAAGGAAGGFRFFPRVAAGVEVVLEPEEQPLPQGTPFPEQFRQRRSPAGWEAAPALAALAADGAAILSTARAAAAKHAAAVGARPPVLCSICGAGVGEAGSGAVGATGGAGGAPQGKKKKKNNKGGAEPAVKPGRKLGEGVVVEPSGHVPHDVRMQRLLGTTPVASGSSCPP
ncbi:hypothetical protein HXX76_004069 [Chlamydomonas incerta]|uniref:Uncharacterized protein n=1 Tax=Chlamydomonas incerta TaxID=51695 RepID=A0A835TJH4_CHLIN|nr:hypothetical protein HXX76_004069 [Chlamydomonas incerta]|eukprot:KAG2439950.1 hypothetical protein HXX76_004069 [Chlamydomonas incerta]